MSPAKTRAEAKALGLKTYFDGRPCKYGHVALRSWSNGSCRNCASKSNAKSYAKNPTTTRTRVAGWQRANPARRAVHGAKWHKKNALKCNARSRAWAAANPERLAALNSAWAKANRGAVNAKAAQRRARKLRATPAWADLGAIKRIYAGAARLGLTVDHIVPLQGGAVCGLHVESNLQLLTHAENASKGNRFTG